MTSVKAKSTENIKSAESSSPMRGFARQPRVNYFQGALDAPSVPQWAGNLAVQHLLRSGKIQAKLLAISQPSDPNEQEADRIADHVMRMAEPAPITSTSGVIQRKCVVCEADGATCPKCENEERIKRREMPSNTPQQANPTVHSQIAGPRGGGQSLSPSVRAVFERRFGANFSQVRVHTDVIAAEAARAINARAFTVGKEISFATGQFSTESGEGKRLLAHELTHVVQQEFGPTLLQRASPTDTPTGDDSNAGLNLEALIQKDRQAFEALKGSIGKPAISVHRRIPQSPADLKAADVFTIQSIVDRSGGSDSRKGFETEALASAFASMNAVPAGAAVVKENGIFFVAKLNPNPSLSLIAHQPSPPSIGLKDLLSLGSYGAKLLTSDWNKYLSIYRIDPIDPARIIMVVGQDGFLFPRSYFNPDEISGSGGIPTDAATGQAAASQLQKEVLPAPPPAAELRALAGLTAAGSKTEIGSDQQGTFIASYFRSRAEESLNTNEKMAEQLAIDFKPATGDAAAASGGRISGAAQNLINSSRNLARDLRTIVETQTIIQGRLDYVENAISRSAHWDAAIKLTLDGKERLALDWKADYIKALSEIAAGILRIRSASPMLALMVPEERQAAAVVAEGTPTTAAPALRGVASMAAAFVSSIVSPAAALPALAANKQVQEFILNRPRTPQGLNQVDASMFGGAQTNESDEKIRAEFEKKLDVAKQAIRRARAEIVHGDVELLFGLPGLRLQVSADLDKNPQLKTKLQEVLDAHELKEIAWTVAETAVQVGSLFLPGGAFISAAIGFGIATRDLGKDLKKWDIAQAGAIDPSTALVSQQEVESALVSSTLMVALSALDLGSSVMPELHAAKVVAADAEGLQKGFVQEIKNIPDAAGGKTHELGMSRSGIPRCSDAPSCLLLAESLRVRAEQLSRIPGDVDVNWFAMQRELQPQLTNLRSKAENLNQRAIESFNLPEPARPAVQAKLLLEAEAVELEMVRIEHKVFGLRGKTLPAAEKSEWLPATADKESVPGEGFWRPSSSNHPAYPFVQEKGPIPYHSRYPNLTKWSEIEISLPGFTERAEDFMLADQAAAARLFQRDPKVWGTGGNPNLPSWEKVAQFRRDFEYTWHHKENSGTLQLVPRALHNSVPHSGGISENIAGRVISP